MARYGLPWQGSKSRIAEWVIDVLPPSHTLVDLFAGGGAITHCALLSGKWEHIIANDMTDSMKVFADAARGEFSGYVTVATREEFMQGGDTALRLLYSFGNNRTSYAFGADIEPIKVAASRMVSAPSMHERRLAYKEFCDALSAYLAGKTREDAAHLLTKEHEGGGNTGLGHLSNITGLERLQGLQGLQGLERLQGMQGDYRLVDIPEGATVYADPPYRGTASSSQYGEFDFNAFDMWLGGVDFPVFVSEFDAPAGCVEIASTERVTSMAANSTDKRTERIFVQERFYGQCKIPTLFDMG